MKICKHCQKRKMNKSFYIAYTSPSTGTVTYSSACKSCSKKISTNWGRKNKTRRLNYLIKHLYGITIENYNQLLKKQKNKCAICYKEQKHKRKRRFDIDHCHKTNKVRGLLCDKCNVGLGKFEDNIKFLNRAIKYLICSR